MASVIALMRTSKEGGGVGIVTGFTVKPKRFALSFQESLLVGWFSSKITTSSPALSSMPLLTKLFPSLVLRVMTISSGVTFRNAAIFLRVSSRPVLNLFLFWGEGSASISRVYLNRTSLTLLVAGHRFAAFITMSFSSKVNSERMDAQSLA